MSLTTETPSAPAWRRRLTLPAYSTAAVARYTGASPQTISSWYFRDGGLGPALGGRERGSPLNYMQLIEVAFVQTFRETGVSLQRLRRARQYVAQVFEAEYPFATYRFKTEGHRVYMDLHDEEPELHDELLVAADEHGQTAWAPAIAERFIQFEYIDDLAIRWRPAPALPDVIIDARLAFGAPTVGGVPTWALRGRAEAGETLHEIAQDFGVAPELVEQALDFERAA